jgi:molecular chaperone IbpA
MPIWGKVYNLTRLIGAIMNALVKQLFEKPFETLNVSSKDFDKFFVGFDDQFDKIAKMSQDLAKNVPNYPPYNIRKVADNKYVIELAIAGFSQSDVEVTIDGNKLTVSGKTTDDAETDYLFKGIANRAFTRTFALADKIEVESAEMVNGMLKIALDKLAEISTVKKIEVKDSSSSKKSKKKFLTEADEYDETAEKL